MCTARTRTPPRPTRHPHGERFGVAVVEAGHLGQIGGDRGGCGELHVRFGEVDAVDQGAVLLRGEQAGGADAAGVSTSWQPGFTARASRSCLVSRVPPGW